MYLCKFDETGYRTSTVVSGIHFKTEEEKAKYIADGYIETSEEDYQYYVGNMGNGANGTGYIRGGDGKPTDAPAYAPSTDEKIAALDAQYNANKSNLLNAYQTALVYGDTDTMESLKADLQALDGQYDEDYERIVREG